MSGTELEIPRLTTLESWILISEFSGLVSLCSLDVIQLRKGKKSDRVLTCFIRFTVPHVGMEDGF